MVDNYTWLIHAFQRPRKFRVGAQIAVIALYLSQLDSSAHCPGACEPLSNEAAKASNGAVNATQSANPLAQYLANLGIDSFHRLVDELQKCNLLNDSSR